MPTELVFSPFELSLLVLLFFAIGVLCGHINGKVQARERRSFYDLVRQFMRKDGIVEADKNDTRLDNANWLAQWLTGTAKRLDALERWKHRFIAHHNREHAAKAAGDGDPRFAAISNVLHTMQPVLQRHDVAINGLVAANGDFNGFKAYVAAIETVQVKHEDRIAVMERSQRPIADGFRDALDEIYQRIETLERAKGPRKSGR